MKRLLFPLLFFWGVVLDPLNAQGIKSFLGVLDWSVRGSLLLFPEDNGNNSAPMPILPSPGGGASWSLNSLFALELSLDLYGNTYDYDYTLKRVVPANDEFRSSFVIGTVLGLQPVFRFKPLGDTFTIRVYGGAALDLRLCFRAYGTEENERHTNSNSPDTKHTVGDAAREVTSYFWSGGRWFLPFIGGGMDFPIMEGILLGFDLRAWFPVYHFWTGENLPAIEGFRFGIGFRASFS
ncbi:MAG: hypothetical protein LBD31_11355 [Treponema sp.]|jgi:hypothetical protein|nr:hypothetical protein [Treponema sp.]